MSTQVDASMQARSFLTPNMENSIYNAGYWNNRFNMNFIYCLM